MRRFAPLALVATLIIAAACSGGSSSSLTGKTWHLTAIAEKTPAFQGVVPAADQAKYAITFNTDGTFNATADCNSVSGTYKTSGSSGLTITIGPSTRVACPDGSFADLFVHALSNASTYAIANDQLTITLTDGGTLTFVVGATAAASSSAAASVAASAPAAASASPRASAAPSPTAKPTAKPTATPAPKPSAGASAKPSAGPTPQPSPGADLIGKTWQLTVITEKVPAFQGVVPAADQEKYTIEFIADGTFAARADCNQVSGTWTATSSGALTLTIGPSTLVACASGSLSDLYVLGLSNAASYAIATDQLTITLRDEGTLVYK